MRGWLLLHPAHLAGHRLARGRSSARVRGRTTGANGGRLVGVERLAVLLFDVELGAAVLRLVLGVVVVDDRVRLAVTDGVEATLLDALLGEPLGDGGGALVGELHVVVGRAAVVGVPF